MPINCGRSRPFLAGAMVLSLLFSCLPVLASGPYPLLAGQSQAHEMTADQLLVFTLDAEAGAAYLFEVDQGGFELKVDIQDPNGESGSFDFPMYGDWATFRDEKEILLIEPERGGQYLITVFTSENTGTIAYPRATFTRIDTDNELLPAYRLMTKAASTYAESDWLGALEILQQTVRLLGSMENAALLGRCRMGVAALYYLQSEDYDNAQKWFGLAESAYRESGDELLASYALQFQATIQADTAHEIEKTPSRGLAPEARAIFDEVLTTFSRVLDVQRSQGNRFAAAGTLSLFGYTYWLMGDYDNAFEFSTRAAEEYQDLKEWGALPWALNNVAVYEFDRGNLIHARDSQLGVLESVPDSDTSPDRALWLDNLGAMHLRLGELDQALKAYSAAKELHEKAADKGHMGDALEGLGDTYLAFGEYELGMEYLEAAVPIMRKHRGGPGLVSLLNSLGQQYLATGKFEAALEAHQEAEEIAVSPLKRAQTLLYMSKVYVATDKSEQALEMLSQAELIADDLEIHILRTEVLKAKGDALLSSGEFRAALESYRLANADFEALGLAVEQSQTLYGMSRSLAGLERHEESAEYASDAIDAVEHHRSSLSTPQLRAFFLAQRQDYYAHLISTLIELQEKDKASRQAHLKQALNYSERSRARSLVDLINEARLAGFENGLDNKRDTLLEELVEARYKLTRKSTNALPQSEVETARRRLTEIENELNLLDIELREDNAAYADLVDPAIQDAVGIQAMLDPDSALLQYALGSEKSFVFLVTPDSMRTWPLPGKSQLEREARVIYEKLRVPSTSREDRDQLRIQIDTFARRVLPPSDALPAQRLLVVADGVLQYLPFSVLLAANDGDGSTSTLSRHEVVNVPSMSVLAVQRKNRGDHKVPDKTVAIFADPVFTTRDRRVSGSLEDTPNAGTAVVSRQSLDLSEPPDLERLPATKYEAETIAGLVNPEALSVHTGFAANRDSVLGSRLNDYRVVHFATHGKIDSRYPALSWLAFSQVDPKGTKQNGLVRLHDIYNLNLNADLVTMSACDTALGREIAGEALTGLVQGFMYSGARSVMASLWQVPDRATAELMGLFYRNLFELEQKPAAALRNAQVELSSKTRFRHPYYWSAFVLQGDWE